MTLRLPESLSEEARKRAQDENTSVHSLVVKAVQQYVDRGTRREDLQDAVTKIKAEFGEALRRLGE